LQGGKGVQKLVAGTKNDARADQRQIQVASDGCGLQDRFTAGFAALVKRRCVGLGTQGADVDEAANTLCTTGLCDQTG